MKAYIGRMLARLHMQYAPSLRNKRLAWSGYGFGHTALRQPGDIRGTVIGKKGRFKGLCKEQGGDV